MIWKLKLALELARKKGNKNIYVSVKVSIDSPTNVCARGVLSHALKRKHKEYNVARRRPLQKQGLLQNAISSLSRVIRIAE